MQTGRDIKEFYDLQHGKNVLTISVLTISDAESWTLLFPCCFAF